MRRAVGASRSAVAAQFVAESGLLGAIGGVLGTVVGVSGVLVASVINGWDPVISIRLTVLAPIGGVAFGLLAGAFPPFRAASVD